MRSKPLETSAGTSAGKSSTGAVAAQMNGNCAIHYNYSVIFFKICPFLKIVITPPLCETTIPTVLVT